MLQDPAVSLSTKAEARISIAEITVAINVIQRLPALQDAAQIGLIALDVATLGELAGARVLTSAVVKQFAAKAGREITDDVATRIALNFYKDMGVDLGPSMYRSAGENATHNPQAAEVVMGSYIPNSSQSYEQIAKARGATYFEMGDWCKTQGLLGADNMWNINKAFLDQQMAQGKSFLFTANPALAKVGSYTSLELAHLTKNGYTIIPDKGGVIVQLSSNHESFVLLYQAVNSFYKKYGDRRVFIFSDQAPTGNAKFYVRFLLERKHVIEYAIVSDRNTHLSGVSLAIGPHYFGPADFWDYENAQRFRLEASTDAIEHNLRLLDEFLVLQAK